MNLSPKDNTPEPRVHNFNDIKLNDSVSFSVEVSESLIDSFAVLSGDYNPLHMDNEFAKSRGFPGRLAHAMLTSSFISRLVGMYLPGRDSLYLSQSLEFLKPVKAKDILKIEGIVAEKSDSQNTLTLKIIIYNQYNHKVISGITKVMFTKEIKKKPISEGGKMNLDLSGKVAIITGSDRGIGSFTALTLARQNAAVVINYRQNRTAAEKLLRAIEDLGGKAIMIKADVSKKDEVDAMVKETVNAFRTVDILINNATFPIQPKPFEETTWEAIQRHIDVEIKGAFNCSKAVLPLMTKKKKGKIVNVITTSVVGMPPIHLADYIIAKYGLLGFSRSLAVEYGPHGINVNMVSPGMTNTDLTAYISERAKKVMAMQTPLRRISEPQDVANIISFLVSESADFISGSNNLVCGGQSML